MTSHSPDSFFDVGPGPDERYGRLYVNAERFYDRSRALVEDLWHKSRPYLDADLREQARFSFVSRFWEMYLASALIDAGRPLIPRAELGRGTDRPDLKIREPLVSIEAVTPERGTGPDAVPQAIPGVVRDVPDDQVILRFTSALAEKHLQWQRFVTSGCAAPDEPFVVALNGGLILEALSEREVPRVVRAAYPFGHLVLHLDIASNEITGSHHQYRPAITKRSGSPVSTAMFEDASLSGISGVLYSWADDYNTPEKPLESFIFVHNLNAANKVPLGFFSFGREYWISGDQLFERTHSPSLTRRCC